MINSDAAFNAIETVNSVSGHSKIEFLKVTNICEYLLAAYDPYTMYYVTKGLIGTGVEQFTDLTWNILEKLSTRELSGQDAKAVVNLHTHEMTPRSSLLFHRILNKDLRMGMGVKSINKAFPGLIPTHDVMLAKLFDAKRLKFPCFGSPKIDGVRAKFKKGKFYSRNGHEYIGLNHLKEQLKDVSTELDGELTVNGKTFQESSGLIRNDSSTPDAVFSLIDLPLIKASFNERLMKMEDLHLIGPNVFSVTHLPLNDQDEVIRFYQACRSTGFEGAVIKPWDYEYKGTRSYDWMKMKQILSEDLVVTNIYGGKGKYAGQLGGVTVKFKGQNNDVGGGFSDQQRIDFHDHPELIIGKCIEVLYMEETDQGNLRHARFNGFRPDKGGINHESH